MTEGSKASEYAGFPELAFKRASTTDAVAPLKSGVFLAPISVQLDLRLQLPTRPTHEPDKARMAFCIESLLAGTFEY